jgi:hypothetical protein
MAKLATSGRKSELAITRGLRMLRTNLLEAHRAVPAMDVKVGKAQKGTAMCMAR